jgi:hypothetical protein
VSSCRFGIWGKLPWEKVAEIGVDRSLNDRRASPTIFWTGRVTNWSLVAVSIVVLVGIFIRQSHVVRGQAELAAVRSTIGALRTAFVIDHLKRHIASGGSSVVFVQRNPFELLQSHPVNYAGEVTQSKALNAPSGRWVFDPYCACVGYAPTDPAWLESENGDPMVWYQVTGAPGPLQLHAKDRYFWQEQLMN